MLKKIKIELEKVQKTLLLPLWGRAVESQKKDPRLVDRMAVEIINKIDYDFTTITKNISWVSQFSWVARSLHVDKTILEFIKNNPKATIVNIGCGLDTTFDRIDNGQIIFYDLDLPDVINLRKNFFQENERRKTISCSFLEDKWFTQLQIKDGILFIAAGVFYYFDENQMKDFFILITNHFSSCEIFFDLASPLGVKVANKKVIKDGGMDETAILKWGIKSAKLIEKWDKRIQLVKEFPMFKGMKTGLPLKMKYGLWMSDLLKIMSMVHLRIEK
jgi:O-methyltransferase involved in polyketide biosynthesis